jgi:hypothetical protein
MLRCAFDITQALLILLHVVRLHIARLKRLICSEVSFGAMAN